MRSGDIKIIQSWLRLLPDYIPSFMSNKIDSIDYSSLICIYQDNLLVGFSDDRGCFIDPLAYTRNLISRERLISLNIASLKVDSAEQLQLQQDQTIESKEIRPDLLNTGINLRKKILILGPKLRNEKIAEKLRIVNIHVDHFDGDIRLYPEIYKENYDLVVSNGYAYKLHVDFLDSMDNKVINLHASFLPWGKGIGALLYDCLFMNPLGISAHLIDSNLDTGGIIYRVRIRPNIGETSRTFYLNLLNQIEQIAPELIISYLNEPLPHHDQLKLLDYAPVASSRFNFESLMRFLPKGYDTEIDQLFVLGCIIKNNAAYLGATYGKVLSKN